MGFRSFGGIAVLFALLCNVEPVSSTCYNPDGTAMTSPAYQACVQTVGTFSQCCGTNWTATDLRIADDQCMSNSLCLNNNPDDNEPLYWCGSCTDPTWKSPLCLANTCTNSSNGGDVCDNVQLYQCTDGSWCCCSTNSTCCSKGLGTKINAVIGVANTTSSTSSFSSSSWASTSTAMDLANSATGSPSPTPSKSAQDTESGMSTGAKAGIWIGVAVLVVASLAGITWFILRGKQKQAMVGGSTGCSRGGFVYGTPQELPGKTAFAEMGSKQPEPFQHEVEGYVPVPVHELASTRYN